MKITAVDLKPLRLAYKQPFHWAQGVISAAEVMLVSIQTDEGLTGYGESMSSATAGGMQAFMHEAAATLIGKDPFAITRNLRDAYQLLFAARGNCSAPRFGAMALAGLDMALWDLAGKATGRPVHDLLGGAVRNHIDYFGFPQGDDPDAIAGEAARWVRDGAKVIYVKIGRGDDLDLAIAAAVRSAIGDRRLRFDANEAWDVLTARRMINALKQHDPEFIEQPTRSDSAAALAQVHRTSPIPLAGDQAIFTPEDVFALCREGAVDLVVIGLHETGGFLRLSKTAAIAEAAGVNVCLHGLYESGITTCASNQAGAVIANLDDGNQYMNHFLAEDILDAPDLKLRSGALPILHGPGLGFELNWDAVARAHEAHSRHQRQQCAAS